MKCEDLVESELEKRMNDLRCGPDVEEYGIMFEKADRDVVDWILSVGGPEDLFRFYLDNGTIHRIEYWYIDWFDGASREVRDDDFTVILDLVADTVNEVNKYTGEA